MPPNELIRETRHFDISDDFEIEERSEDNELVLTALAHRTGVKTKIHDYTESISPGAFRSAIGQSDIVLNVNHGRSSGVLARTSSGTMKVWENDSGLMLRARLGKKDPEALSLISKMERGDLSELSFAFTLEGGKQTWDASGDIPHREIKRVGRLFDVSVVERPAYDQTGVVSMRDEEAAHLARLSGDVLKAESMMRQSMIYKALMGK